MTTKKFSILLSPAAYGCLRGALKATELKTGIPQCQDVIEIDFHDNADLISVGFTGTQGSILAHLSALVENGGACAAPHELLKGLSPVGDIPTDGGLRGCCLPSAWVKATFPAAGRYARLEFEQVAGGWRCHAEAWGGKKKLRLLKSGACELTPYVYPDWSRCLPAAHRFKEETSAGVSLQAGMLAAIGSVADAVTCAADDGAPVAFTTRVFTPNQIYAEVRPGFTDYADSSFRSISGVVVAMGMRL